MIAQGQLFRAVLGVLVRVTGPDREGWHTALCPFHDDRDHPNLRLNLRGFRCMACGAKGNLGELAERMGVAATPADAFPRRIEATYDYRDEHGDLLFQVVRLSDPKDFLQRRPDSKGGWIWNLKRVRRVIYRMPELLAADPSEPVFVVEGEKDVDNLARLGVVATTNPGGAGKWRKEYNGYLADRKVVILPDNDEAGGGHAEEVARCGATRVALLRLPGLPEKGDVSDWIAAGGTKEELLNLVASLEPVTPSLLALASDDEADAGKGNAADRIVQYALSSGAELFHDQRSDPYMAFREQRRRQIWPLRSQAARHWLSYLAWRAEHKAPSSETVRTALGVLEAIARFEGEEHQLNVRIASHDGAIWYDLGDWRAVRIDSSGWGIVDEPPILFRHFALQKPQVEPVAGGDLRDLLSLVNLRDGPARLLLLAYVVVAMIPDIPRPIIVVRGEHGSGKSTLFVFIRDLLDPSLVTRGSAPDSLREFVQAASHGLCLYLDNLSYLPDWMSDALCRLCTGDGFSKRQLYTDDDDIIYSLRGLGGVNGINLVATRPDLLDRALIFSLEAIADPDRRLEKACQDEFEWRRPRLLGAMFNALSAAMKEIDGIQLTGLPRMADFARWGCAVSRALGFSQAEFLDALGCNVREQNNSALENSPVAQAVLALVQRDHEWEDTPAQTLARLNEIAESLRIDTRAKQWPKSPSVLTKRLNEVRPNLLRAGILIKTGGHTGDRRTIAFRRTENAVNAVNSYENAVSADANAVSFDGISDDAPDSDSPLPDGVDGTDGIFAIPQVHSPTLLLWEEEVP